MSQSSPAATDRLRVVGPLLVAATGTVMLWWTWGTWPDSIVDFGREIYLPWRLSEGDVLYRDAIHFNGPLSPYLNALLFRCFGVSLRTLVLFNLALTACIALMLHHLLRVIAGRRAATVGGIVFFSLFAFSQYLVFGNFNYLCPYSHELTHGMAIVLASLLLVEREARSPRGLHRMLAGLLLGLAFLTKVEVFLAVLVATAVGWAALLFSRRANRNHFARTAGTLLVAGALPPLLAWMLLARVLPAADALRGVLGAWPWVLTTNAPSMRFFRNMSGFLDPVENVFRLLAASAAYVAVFLVVRMIERRTVSTFARRFSAAAVFLVLFGLLMLPTILGSWRGNTVVEVLESSIWADAFRPLPLLCIAALFASARRLRSFADDGARQIVLLAFSAAALTLLLKMILVAHVYAYGFVHALLASMLGCALLVDGLPRRWGRIGSTGGILRSAGVAIITAAIATHVYVQRYFVNVKEIPVASGGDAFRADARGLAINLFLAEIRKAAKPGDRMAAFPEGLLLNYLARIPHSKPHYTFIPPQIEMYGEEAMLAALQSDPPEWVAIVHRHTNEYGSSIFGKDYAQRIYSFLQERYDFHRLFGASPFSSGRFGILLLRRR